MKYVSIIIVVSLFLSSCAGFRNSTSSISNQDRVTFSKKAKAKIYYQTFFDANMAANTILKNKVDSTFVSALESSNCCEIVNADEADLQVRVTLSVYENPAALVPAVITGFSLYQIPSWAKIKYSYAAEVITKDKQVKNYKSEDSWTVVQWLPMLLVFPFKPIAPIPKAIFNDMHNDLLTKLKADGVL